MLGHDVLAKPHLSLIVIFAAWKLFLFAIAAGSRVGDAYDTSASLALGPEQQQGLRSVMSGLAARFSSWDAIFFTQVARRGYAFEQEWAFGPGLPIVTRAAVKCEFPPPPRWNQDCPARPTISVLGRFPPKVPQRVFSHRQTDSVQMART
jgi:hypothetical protein